MPGRTLFVGDSHSAGYWAHKIDEPYFGSENCYGRIYSQEIEPCVVYADPGAPNSVYPRWISTMLKKYIDIDKVVIQTTHWDRWKMGHSTELGFTQLPNDYFLATHEEQKDFVLHTDFSTVDYSIVEWSDKIKFNGENLVSGNQKWPQHWTPKNWPGDTQEYYNTVVHHQVLTHLVYEQYCKDIALIDSMCKTLDIPVYIWRINDHVELPNILESFVPLTQTKLFTTSAETWIKDNLNIDIATMLQDEVHYNVEAHKLIATKFIPEVLNA